MKKLFLFLLVLVLVPVFSVADGVDLSAMSLEELYALRSSVSAEILSRSQWESVTVPEGFYVVGEDIPAGHWTIRYVPGEASVIEYFLNTDATGKQPADILHDYYSDGVSDPESPLSVTIPQTQIDLDLKPGYHVVISFGPAIFEPYTGRPSPFFN